MKCIICNIAIQNEKKEDSIFNTCIICKKYVLKFMQKSENELIDKITQCVKLNK